MDISTTIHYSLSAMAQVSGALLAIGGAVVVFKLQIIEKERNDFRDRVIKAMIVPIVDKDETNFYYKTDDVLIEKYEELKSIIYKNDDVDDRVASSIEKNYGKVGSNKSWCIMTYNSFRSLIKSKSNVMGSYKKILLILGASVILSIILLSFAFYECIVPLFYLDVGVTVFSIIYSIYLSWIIFRADIFDKSFF